MIKRRIYSSSIASYFNSQIPVIKIPKGNVVKKIDVRLKSVQTFATYVGAVSTYKLVNLVDKIKLFQSDENGNNEIKNIEPMTKFKNNNYIFNDVENIGVTTDGAQTFKNSISLDMGLYLNGKTIHPFDQVAGVPTGNNDLYLEITLGDLDDVFSTATGRTAGDTTMEIFVHYENAVNFFGKTKGANPIALFEITKRYVPNSTGDFDITDIPLGRPYHHFIIDVVNDGVRDSTLIDDVTVILNDTIKPIENVPFNKIREWNADFFERKNSELEDGFAILDFDEDSEYDFFLGLIDGEITAQILRLQIDENATLVDPEINITFTYWGEVKS